jgi:DNA-binding NarL/FixJ family response regulator
LRGSGAQRDPTGSDITDRESDILRLMAAGLTNAAIADALHLSDKTVRNYVSSIFHKMGATSRVDAVVRARKAGLG